MQISICAEGPSLCKHLHRHVLGKRGPLSAVRADRISLLLHTVTDLEGIRYTTAQG